MCCKIAYVVNGFFLILDGYQAFDNYTFEQNYESDNAAMNYRTTNKKMLEFHNLRSILPFFTCAYGFEMEQKVRRVIAPCPRNKILEKEMSRIRDDRGKKKLVTACCICVLFMVLELVGKYLVGVCSKHSKKLRQWKAYFLNSFLGGYVAGSLAIMSDAAHMAADVSTFVVSLYAAHLTRKGIKPHKTFGFHRAEVLGALFSITSLWVVTLML